MNSSHWMDVLVFVLTYLVFGVVLAAVLRRCLTTPKTDIPATTILLFGLGLAPWLTASLLFVQFGLFPKSHPVVYISMVLGFYASLAFWSRGQFPFIQQELRSRFHGILADVRQLSSDCMIALAFCVLILGYILYQSTAFPITGHDGSVYAFLGDYLSQERSLANYPMVTPDLRTGARMTLEHPPGLPLLYAWFHLFAPGGLSLLPRTVSAMSALYVVLLVFDLLHVRRNLPTAIIGMLVVLLVPAFVWQSFDNSIDPPRLFLLLSSLALLAFSFDANNAAIAGVAGMCAGFAAFVHASGVLTILVGIAVIVVFQRRSVGGLLRFMPAFCGAAVLFGASHYASNFVRFGNLLGPSTYDLFDINVSGFYHTTEVAHRNQHSEIGRLIFGRLQVLFRPELFGVTFWLVLLAPFVWKRLPGKRPLDRVLLLGLIMFAAPVLYKFYSNRRYILTVLPCAAYLGGLFLGSYYTQLRSKKVLTYVGGLLVLSVMVVSLLLPSSILSNKLSAGAHPLQFLIGNKTDRNRAIDGGIDAAIRFVNAHTPRDSVILVSDERFFRRAERKGVLWGSMNRLCKIYRTSYSRNHEPQDLAQIIDDQRVGYILIDHVKLEAARASNLGVLLADETRCALVHDGEAKVWKWSRRDNAIASNPAP